MRKFLLAALLAILAACPTRAQLASVGSEVPITYPGIGKFAVLATNLPATTFNTPGGSNTFNMAIDLNVAARIYITNTTANACVGAFQVQIAATGSPGVTSFNNNTANWQTVPIVSIVTGSYAVNSGVFNIPASGTVSLTSAAISGLYASIQILNTTGGCATTSVTVTVLFTPVSINSPLLNVNGNAVPGLGTGNVQGISPAGSSANLILPVLESGAGPFVNGGFTTSGLDTTTGLAEVKGFTGTGQTVTTTKSPVPAQGVSEFSLAIYTGLNGSCGSKVFNPAWTLQGAQGGPTTLNAATMFPAVGGTLFTYGITTPCTWTNNTQIGTTLNFNATGILTFNAGVACCAPAISAPNNPAGATVVIIVPCPSATACSVTSISDTLGMNWAQIESFSDTTISGAISGIVVWANTSANPGGADTVTVTATGSPTVVGYATLSGVTATNLVQPQIPLEVDALGGSVMRMDAAAPNQWLCDVTLTTVATTQCLAAPSTINGIPVRAYVTDIQIYTSVAGTATTVSLRTGTGVNCASSALALTQMQYANTTVGMTTAIGFRTPFVAPLQTAVCAVQTGTTAGTSIVELHGFYAP